MLSTLSTLYAGANLLRSDQETWSPAWTAEEAECPGKDIRDALVAPSMMVQQDFCPDPAANKPAAEVCAVSYCS